MPPTGETYFALQEQGGLPHSPESIPSHLQTGLKDIEFMQSETATLDVETAFNEGNLAISVKVTNSGAGHHIPTDHPGRNILLVVEVFDEDGLPIEIVEGPVIPSWGGDLAGTPGKGYAKVLKDVVTGESPVVSYWKQVLIASDNRIPAMENDTTKYVFLTNGESCTVQVRLVFRRMFQPIAERYVWEDEDILLVKKEIQINP